jgi:hypothetical protein
VLAAVSTLVIVITLGTIAIVERLVGMEKVA